jgi:hypothetical protein
MIRESFVNIMSADSASVPGPKKKEEEATTLTVDYNITASTITASQIVCDVLTITGTGYALDNTASQENLTFSYNDGLKANSLGIPDNATLVINNRLFQNLQPLPMNRFQDESGYVALAKSAAPMTSFQNGVKTITHWNQTNAYLNTIGWRDLEWSSELNLFVTVSTSTLDASLPAGATNIQWSNDGLVWNNVNWAGPGLPGYTEWSAVRWSANASVFVAVATLMALPNSSHFAYSANGKDWTMVPYDLQRDGLAQIDSPGLNDEVYISGMTWADLAWSSQLNLFACVSNNNMCLTITVNTNPLGVKTLTFSTPKRILTEYDTDAVVGNLVPQFNSVTWAPELGKFVSPVYVYTKLPEIEDLLQPPGDGIVYSPDGLNWTFVPLPENLKGAYSAITWSPQLGLLVAVSEKVADPTVGSAIITSYTGLEGNWVGVPYAQTGGNNERYRCISWAPEYNMLITTAFNPGTGNNICYSFNGIQWSRLTDLVTDAYKTRNIVYSRELCSFVMVAYRGATNRGIFTSSNVFKLPGPNNVFNACFNKIDEAGNWGMGSGGQDIMPATAGVANKTGGYLCVPAGGLGANTLPSPLTLSNGIETGYAPLFFDTTSNKLYIYNSVSNTWKSTAFA